jgi:hypothetical protein
LATNTENYNLVKPNENDYYDIGIQNDNMDKIDAELKKAQDHRENISNPHQVTAEQTGAIPSSEKGTPNGVATLDSDGKLEQMPTASDVEAIPKARNLIMVYDDNITLTAEQSGSVVEIIGTGNVILPNVSEGNCYEYILLNNTTDDRTVSTTDNSMIGWNQGNKESYLTVPAGTAIKICSDGWNWFLSANPNFITTGTWTPTLYGLDTAGTPTYKNSTGGLWVKIRGLVFISGNLVVDSLGDMDGELQIGGLPFPVDSYGNSIECAVINGSTKNINGILVEGTSGFLTYTGTDNITYHLKASHISNDSFGMWGLSGVYKTAL